MKTFTEFTEQMGSHPSQRMEYMPAIDIYTDVQQKILPQLRHLKGLPIEKRVTAVEVILQFLRVSINDLQQHANL